MANEATALTQDELTQLPLWALVAFTARCARRGLPVFRKRWPKSLEQQILVLEEAVDSAEVAASTATPAVAPDLHTAAYAAVDAAVLAGAEYSHCANAAAEAYAAAYNAANPDIATALLHASGNAIIAIGYTYDQSGGQAIRRDFQRLLDASHRLNWTNDTPVPPSVFGPLDELMDDETLAKALSVQLFAPDGTDPHVIGDALVKLWEAANEYHMARGGGVLTIADFKQMMLARTLVPVGPESEG